MSARGNREIERKFLIKRLPPNLKRARNFKIAQGYLVTEPDDRHVRLRKKGNACSLTFKLVRGHVRDDLSYRLAGDRDSTQRGRERGGLLHDLIRPQNAVGSYYAIAFVTLPALRQRVQT